nr:GNAT family N-acetyltransferase [Candidatus Enterousia merdequi]
MQKINFDIVPIFNQSESTQIWHDFTKLELKCGSEIYGYRIDDKYREDIFSGFVRDWICCKYNMAFAAYHNEQMIGFVTGYKSSGTWFYLRNLYVNPEYNGMGIGRNLLSSIEKSASLLFNNIELVALDKAVSFYEKYGYTNFDGRNMTKKLPKSFVGTAPVFQWSGKLNSRLNMEIDCKLLKQYNNCPILVYVSLDKKIDGVAVKTPDGKNIVWTNQNRGQIMSDFYKQLLLKSMARIR